MDTQLLRRKGLGDWCDWRSRYKRHDRYERCGSLKTDIVEDALPVGLRKAPDTIKRRHGTMAAFVFFRLENATCRKRRYGARQSSPA